MESIELNSYAIDKNVKNPDQYINLESNIYKTDDYTFSSENKNTETSVSSEK